MAVKKKVNAEELPQDIEGLMNEGNSPNEVDDTTVDETTVDETEATKKEDEEKSGIADGITVDPDPTLENPVKDVKKVKIKPNCNYRFYYGTTWYTLCEGVIMSVPVEVKDRLQKAGKLSAL